MSDSDGHASPRPWSVVASRITYRDRWLTLRSDTCVTPDGTRIDPYHVLEFPDWVNVVALTRNEEGLVLVREYRHGYGRVVTGLVSGTVDAKDTGHRPEAALAAARRELEEETGYRGGTFIPVLTAYANPANQTNLVSSFLAFDLEPGGRRALDESEAVEPLLDDLPSVLLGLRRGDRQMQVSHVSALWAAAGLIMGGGPAVEPLGALRRRLVAALAGT